MWYHGLLRIVELWPTTAGSSKYPYFVFRSGSFFSLSTNFTLSFWLICRGEEVGILNFIFTNRLIEGRILRKIRKILSKWNPFEKVLQECSIRKYFFKPFWPIQFLSKAREKIVVMFLLYIITVRYIIMDDIQKLLLYKFYWNLFLLKWFPGFSKGFFRYSLKNNFWAY